MWFFLDNYNLVLTVRMLLNTLKSYVLRLAMFFTIRRLETSVALDMETIFDLIYA